MKLKKETLEQLIKEEVQRVLKEADKDEKAPEEDAQEPKDKKVVNKDKKQEKPSQNKDKKQVKKQELSDDPADDELDAEQEEEVEDPDDEQVVGSGKVSDEVNGKSVQSLTLEPKSKILPGAQEIVFTFTNTPDPLKILVTKSGKVVFYFKGEMHNIP